MTSQFLSKFGRTLARHRAPSSTTMESSIYVCAFSSPSFTSLIWTDYVTNHPRLYWEQKINNRAFVYKVIIRRKIIKVAWRPTDAPSKENLKQIQSDSTNRFTLPPSR